MIVRSVSGFRKILRRLEEAGLLLRIKEPKSTEYDIARELKKVDGEKAVLIERPVLPDGRESEIKVAGGIANRVDSLLLLLGLESRRELRELLRRASREGIPPERADEASVKEVEWAPHKLRDLPILKHYSGEPGPFITAGIVIARDEEVGGYCISYHRMMPVGPDRLVLRAVEGRWLHRLICRAEERGEELPVSVSIGSNIGLIIAGATPAEGRDKLSMAGAIMGSPVPIVECETVEAVMPADSEIVLEGTIIPWEKEKEGPFYEILGRDGVREQPVLRVTRIWMRKEAIYQAILPAGKEHEILMGLPVESVIEEAVSRVAEVKDVCMTPAGRMWIEAAVSIKKRAEGQPVLVGMAAISAHKSLKRVIVVDEDVDCLLYTSPSPRDRG